LCPYDPLDLLTAFLCPRAEPLDLLEAAIVSLFFFLFFIYLIQKKKLSSRRFFIFLKPSGTPHKAQA
jgi:hypothetical protein